MFGFFKKKRPAEPLVPPSQPEFIRQEFISREEFLELLKTTPGYAAFARWGSAFGDEGYKGLPPLWRSLAFHHYCYSDTLNGGFYQLFRNGSGDYFDDFVGIYDRMVATEPATLVRNAAAFFPDGPPSDRDARNDLMDRLGLTEKSFSDVDDKFFEWSLQPQDKITALYDSYLSSHVDELWPPDFQIRTPRRWPPRE